MDESYFYNENEALNYIENILWDDGINCIHCGNKRVYSLKGNSHRIGLKTCSDCRKQFTLRIGTIFESSHIPLYKWLQAGYLIACNETNISQLHKILGVTYKTAWSINYKIRGLTKEITGICDPNEFLRKMIKNSKLKNIGDICC